MNIRTNGLWVIKGPANHIVAAWVTCRLTTTPHSPEDWNDFKAFQVADLGYIRMQFHNWKWYEDSPDIQFFESVWDSLEAYAEDNPGTLSGRRVHISDATDEREFGEYVPDIYAITTVQDDEPADGEPINQTPTPA